MGLLNWFRKRGWALTGVGRSGPVFGKDGSASEQVVIAELLIDLSDRRCLSAHYDGEYEGWVMDSVIAIRAELTEILKRLRIESPRRLAVIRMRDATRAFMSAVPEPHRVPFSHLRNEYRDALAELRKEFREALETLTEHGSREAGEIVRSIPEGVDGPRFDPSQLAPPQIIHVEPKEKPRLLPPDD